MARHWNPIMMNAVLFGRIALLHDNRSHTWPDRRGDAAAGADLHPFPPRRRRLDEAAKKRMAEINERLADLGTSFSHHLLGDEQEWFMELGEDDRAGCPRRSSPPPRPPPRARGMPARRS
jgi:peptidyl-dipeptidase Dcp